ncbi:hypothetical protein [Streptomyces sp. NPDC085937]|uniref:hypothetical protein n=1 Tax=Streptomyces sp. NPDC085937 TaxID=3365742 RepID=UPI0037D36DF3
MDALVARAEQAADGLPTAEGDAEAAADLTEQERREVEEAWHSSRAGTGRAVGRGTHAWVALTAARHGSAVIFTTDPHHIRARLAVLAPKHVHVVAV